MLVDEFGYESLLFMLAKNGIKIYLDNKRKEIFKRQDMLENFCNDLNEANIILVDTIAVDIEKQRLDDKIIIIKFVPELNEPDSKSLKLIRYSVHPTIADISFIATLAAPLNIYTIGHSIDVPFDLRLMCRHR